MTRDRIQAEFDAFFEFPTPDKSTVSSASCVLFAKLMADIATTAEREQCAKVCDELAHKQRDYMLLEDADGCDLCAEAIRARGK